MDTPRELPELCPICHPEDEGVIYYCDAHRPDSTGVDDHLALGLPPYLSGGAEAGGEENRVWCAFIHRKRAQEAPE